MLAVHRQPYGHRGADAELTVNREAAAVQINQAFDDRQPQTRAVMPPVIGAPCLKERIAKVPQIG